MSRENVRLAFSEAAKTLATPEAREHLADNDLLATGLSPGEFAEFLSKDVVRQAAIAKSIGIQPQ